jgi:glycosyltransferase involved in cell wall biosynthesis
VPDPPLVTAIMPARDRPEFAVQAVRYFCDQDYPNKEMVVLEDGSPSLAGRLPDDPRIRYIATGAPYRSIGAMRNEACQLARGEIVAHWDDDDWYGPQRLTRQVEAIRSGEADLTALRDSLMLDVATWRFWRCQPDLHRRIFYIGDVHGATMMYRRRIWEEAKFPDQSLAEDAIFLQQALDMGSRLQPIDAEGYSSTSATAPTPGRWSAGNTPERTAGRSCPSPTWRRTRAPSTRPSPRPPPGDATYG